jgi:hypothetical protein
VPQVLSPSRRILDPQFFNDLAFAWKFDTDGQNQFARVYDCPLDHPPEPFSMAAWVYPIYFLQVRQIISIGSMSVAAADSWELKIDDPRGGNKVSAASRDGPLRASKAPSATNSVWSHVGGVWANDSSRLAYKNGIAGTENTDTVTPDVLGGMEIGSWARYENGEDTMHGGIWLPAIWDAALNAHEMYSLSRGAWPWEIRLHALRCCWVGRNFRDIIGGYDMEPVGGYKYMPSPFARTRPPRMWFTPLAAVPAAPAAGQPMMLRATTVRGMRQWQPRL